MTFENSKKRQPELHLCKVDRHLEGMSRFWLESNKFADESSIGGTIQLLLERRFSLICINPPSNANHTTLFFGYNIKIE